MCCFISISLQMQSQVRSLLQSQVLQKGMISWKILFSFFYHVLFCQIETISLDSSFSSRELKVSGGEGRWQLVLLWEVWIPEQHKSAFSAQTWVVSICDWDWLYSPWTWVYFSVWTDQDISPPIRRRLEVKEILYSPL